jgi:hypothetical protein
VIRQKREILQPDWLHPSPSKILGALMVGDVAEKFLRMGTVSLSAGRQNCASESQAAMRW